MPHTTPLFQQLELIPASKIYAYKLIRESFRNPEFLSMCNRTVKQNIRPLRNNTLFNIPFVRTEYLKQSVNYTVPVYRNNVSNVINDASSLPCIKKILKTHYINEYLLNT